MLLRFAFWTLSLLIAVSSLRFLVLPMNVVMAHMLHYLPDYSLTTYAHLIGGPLALMLAPFQLWQGLRQRRPRLHRAIGYGYAMAVLIAGIGSLIMLPGFEGAAWVAAGFAALGLLWIGTTATGILQARNRNLAAHQRWMQRSVALSFAAVTLRLIMAPLMAAGWTPLETYQITAWGSWLLNLAVLEIWRLAQKQKGTREGALFV